MSNIYEQAGREKKAAQILVSIHEHGWAHLVHDMEPRHWEFVAQKAGVKPPSAETIALVKQRIQEARKAK